MWRDQPISPAFCSIVSWMMGNPLHGFSIKMQNRASGQDEQTETRFSFPSAITQKWDKMYETMAVEILAISNKGQWLWGGKEQLRKAPWCPNHSSRRRNLGSLHELQRSWDDREAKAARVFRAKYWREGRFSKRILQRSRWSTLSLQLIVYQHMPVRKLPKAGRSTSFKG